MTRQDALEILHLSNHYPTQAEIKAAYRNQAKVAHPDKGGTSEDFIRVRRAYILLRDELINSSRHSESTQQSQDEKKYYNNSHNSQYSQDRSHSNRTNHSHSNESNEHSHASWQQRYYDLLSEFRYKDENLTHIQKINSHLENQIESIIRLFNSGQHVLNTAQQEVNEQLSRIDRIYEEEHAKITKLYRGTFINHILGRQRLSYNEYVKLNNKLVREIQKLEDTTIRDYHKRIEAIYQEIMTSIYNILSV